MAYISIDVDIEEFDDHDLIKELQGRGYHCAHKTISTVTKPPSQSTLLDKLKREIIEELSELNIKTLEEIKQKYLNI